MERGVGVAAGFGDDRAEVWLNAPKGEIPALAVLAAATPLAAAAAPTAEGSIDL